MTGDFIFINGLVFLFIYLLDYIFINCRKAVDEQPRRNDRVKL